MKKSSQAEYLFRPVLGAAIARARVKRGWTQHELARRSGVSRDTIAYRENRNTVRGDLAAQFDAAFGGRMWRESPLTMEDEQSMPEILRQLTAQVAELKQHVLVIERNITRNRRK